MKQLLKKCAAALLAALLLGACAWQVKGDKGAQSAGAVVTVKLAQPAARTLLPTEDITFSKFTVAITGSANPDPVTVNGDESAAFNLGTGSYTATVTAYRSLQLTADSSGAIDHIVARGSANFEVGPSDETKEVTVATAPTYDAETEDKGIFKYNVSLPTAEWDTATLTLKDSGNTVVGLEGSSDPIDLETGATGSIEAAPGNYTLDLLLVKANNEIYGESWAVQIYASLTTWLGADDAAYDLSEASFVTKIRLAGTAPLTTAGTVAAYSDNAYSEVIAGATGGTVSDYEWALDLPVSVRGNPVYLKLTSTTTDDVADAYTGGPSNIVTSVTPVVGNAGNTGITFPMTIAAIKLVNAEVLIDTPNTVQVTFNKAVAIDKSKIAIKIAGLPTGDASTGTSSTVSYLDVSSTNATINSVATEAPNKVWDIILAEAVKFGDIVRFAVTSGGVSDPKFGATAPVVNGLIAQNLVPHAAYPSAAGFTANGAPIGVIPADESLLLNALTYLTGGTVTLTGGSLPGAYPQNGKTSTVVLSTNQTLANAPALTDAMIGGGTGTHTLVITTNGDTPIYINVTAGSAFTVPKGLTLVLDEHVVVKGLLTQGSSLSTDPGEGPSLPPLVVINDGGRVIIDGASLQDNFCRNTITSLGAGVTMGGSTNGSYLVINKGKITGNLNWDWRKTTDSPAATNQNRAGGVGIENWGAVVMHGGEVSDNEYHVGTGPMAGGRAGGIAGGFLDSDTAHGKASFYMTSGTISDNKFDKLLVAPAVPSVGGLLVDGAFQKTGGTIYGASAASGSANTSNNTAGTHYGAIMVMLDTVPSGTSDTKRKDTADAGPTVSLFVDSFKGSSSAAATNTVPTWADSGWD